MSGLPRCNAGPSADARAKGILKRQRKAGTQLGGGAAKVKRRSQLLARGVTDPTILDELTKSVGLPGVPFDVNVASRYGNSIPQLPDAYKVQQVTGEQDACAVLLAYHERTCDGRPDTVAGRDYALARGWAGPQQALALAGHHPGSLPLPLRRHASNCRYTATAPGAYNSRRQNLSHPLL